MLDDVPDGARAIVVLGGPDRYSNAPEYQRRDSPGSLALERLRFAAHLQRKSGLPILAVGGNPLGEQEPGAILMRDSLSGDFRVPVKWVVAQSRHTFDNARYAAEALHREGITEILLVTHAWHMRRAVAAFEAQGLELFPAPTALYTPDRMTSGWLAWAPRASALQRNSWGLHELVGLVWFGLFY